MGPDKLMERDAERHQPDGDGDDAWQRPVAARQEERDRGQRDRVLVDIVEQHRRQQRGGGAAEDAAD